MDYLLQNFVDLFNLNAADTAYFLQQLINGITLGSIYGLIAIGYTMVYGIIGMINFAHGDIFMVGAFKVDADGFQVAHKMVTFQWQDGKKVIVWPEDLAPGRPRYPTPPWSQRP